MLIRKLTTWPLLQPLGYQGAPIDLFLLFYEGALLLCIVAVKRKTKVRLQNPASEQYTK